MKTAILSALDQALSVFTRYPALRRALAEEQTPTHLLAIGKAAYRMAEVATMAIPAAKLRSCIVLTKYGFYPEDHLDRMFSPVLLEAGHPLPDTNSLKHSRFILEWMSRSLTRISLSCYSPEVHLLYLKPHGTRSHFRN